MKEYKIKAISNFLTMLDEMIVHTVSLLVKNKTHKKATLLGCFFTYWMFTD